MGERAFAPLPAGLYKLHETRGLLEETLAEIGRIEEYKKSQRYAAPTMLHCTPSDMKKWLEEVPNTLLEIFGYDIVPSISALKNDLVPHNIVTELSQRYLPTITSLLNSIANLDSDGKNLTLQSLKIIQSILDDLEHLGYDYNDR